MLEVRRALIAGCGDIGCRLALLLAAQGIVSLGIVRSERSAAALRSLGIEAMTVDLDDPDSAATIGAITGEAFDLLFHFAPPPSTGSSDTSLRRLLAAMTTPPTRFVYLSTSAVYGDCQGRWVDEDAALQPCTERGLRRLDAERAVLAYAEEYGTKAMILRVPGIYGPGRLPLERLRKRTPVLRRADAPFSNRIHADDLARAARHVAQHGVAGAAYNVSDGHPTSMTDYFLQCATLLDLPAPPEVSPDEARRSFSPMLLSFIDESRRLLNTRLLALGWQPRHASLETGLPACLTDDLVADAFSGAADA